MFRLAHLSDLHATQVRFAVSELPSVFGKRGMGWFSWRFRRRREYRPELLDLFADDLREQAPDHIAITGDLTHLGLRAEIDEARNQLEALGASDRLSLVPGNHDAYRAPIDLAAWMAFTRGDRARREVLPCWERGPVALLGLDSARPTPWPLASGWLGEHQLSALDRQLETLGARGLYRVLLIHHPPYAGATSERRALRDCGAVGEILAHRGAELVLHGHVHRSLEAALPGPAAPIPCIGVRAATARGRRPDSRGRYHLFRIEGDRPPYRTVLEIRGLHELEDRVVALGEHVLGAA